MCVCVCVCCDHEQAKIEELEEDLENERGLRTKVIGKCLTPTPQCNELCVYMCMCVIYFCH